MQDSGETCIVVCFFFGLGAKYYITSVTYSSQLCQLPSSWKDEWVREDWKWDEIVQCWVRGFVLFQKISKRPYFPMPEMPAYSDVIIMSVALINILASPGSCKTVTGPGEMFYLSHLASGYRRWSLPWRFWQRDNTLERLSNKPQRRRTALYCLFSARSRSHTNFNMPVSLCLPPN